MRTQPTVISQLYSNTLYLPISSNVQIFSRQHALSIRRKGNEFSKCGSQKHYHANRMRHQTMFFQFLQNNQSSTNILRFSSLIFWLDRLWLLL